MESQRRNSREKKSFRWLGNSVCVLSTYIDGLPYTCVPAAVHNLHRDTPSLLVCFDRRSSLIPLFTRGHEFAVNIFSPDHELLSEHYTQRAGNARWLEENWICSEGEVPSLAGAQTVFFCSIAEYIPYYTHHFAVGVIEDIK